jgi:NADH-quinone oxidoreductase subunit C
VSAEELAAEAADALSRAEVAAETAVTFDEVTVDVSSADWVRSLAVVRDQLHMRFFDWLTAVDQLEDGFDVVAHLYDPDHRRRVLVRTRVPATGPSLATATGVYRGAAWHERETSEMFGIDFPGHPYLVPLLLPDGFEGSPLRKDFVLASRASKSWPGAKEPGESEREGAPSRRKMQPPGVPDPVTWGPRLPGGGDDSPGEDADPAGAGDGS